VYLARCTSAPTCGLAASLFDYFAGDGEHPGRNGDAERLGRLKIDDELEFDRAHHRQIGRDFAPEHRPA
jgi:hypothetical protein